MMDVEVIMPEADMNNPAVHVIKGKANFMNIISTDFESVPDFRMDIKRSVVADQTAVIECIQEGTDMSAFVQGFTGAAERSEVPIPVKIRSVFLFDFRDGKIVRMASFYDLFNFLVVQLDITADQALMLRQVPEMFA